MPRIQLVSFPLLLCRTPQKTQVNIGILNQVFKCYGSRIMKKTVAGTQLFNCLTAHCKEDCKACEISRKSDLHTV